MKAASPGPVFISQADPSSSRTPPHIAEITTTSPIRLRMNMTALIRDALVQGKAETLFALDAAAHFGRLRIEDDMIPLPIFPALI